MNLHDGNSYFYGVSAGEKACAELKGFIAIPMPQTRLALPAPLHIVA